MEPLFVLLRTRAAAKAVLLGAQAPTLYELLGVSPGACGEEELRAGRNALARMFHPDRNADRKATQLTAEANAAYTVLSDSASRARYDASLRTTHLSCPRCAGVGFGTRSRGFTGEVDRLRCTECGGWGWVRKGAKK